MISARAEAVRIAREKLALQPLYLDTETTGTDPNSEIVEICIIEADGAVRYETLVKPVGKMTAEAARVHGITETSLVGAPRWMHVWPQIEPLLAGRQVGAYNADFDLRMLLQTHAKYRLRWNPESVNFFCIMKLYAQFVGEWNPKTGGYRYHSLEAAGQQCGLALPNSHRACDDTRLARALLHHIATSTPS